MKLETRRLIGRAVAAIAKRLRIPMSGLEVTQIQDRYEAGRYFDPRRSFVPGYIQDARFDADIMSRLEIVRKARYFERNNAIVNRLADLFEQYTVGPTGLKFIPKSSDLEWNAHARDFWNRWCETPDVMSLWDFGTIQSLIARTWFIDGEMFIIKTNGKTRVDEQSFPRIQLVETHRVQTPHSAFNDSSVFDGLKIDPRGRPVQYFVRQGGGPEEAYVPYNAKDVIHVGEPSRTGMYRPLSFLYPVLNDLHDLDDLQLLEMDCAKEAAQTTSVIKTKTGEVTDEELRRARFDLPGSNGTSGGSAMERTQYYQDVFMGRTKVLKEGDEYAQFNIVRPSESQFKQWDYLTSKICAGAGISKLLVFPWSMQGTVTRADLDVAATFFRSRSNLLASKFRQIYLYVMEWGTRNNRNLVDPPADWNKVTIRPPRSVNVDVGRNANALIAEYVAGWRTLEDICGELGGDWEEVLIQRAVEFARATQIETEYKLNKGQLIEAALEVIKAQPAIAGGNQQQPQPQPQHQAA